MTIPSIISRVMWTATFRWICCRNWKTMTEFACSGVPQTTWIIFPCNLTFTVYCSKNWTAIKYLYKDHSSWSRGGGGGSICQNNSTTTTTKKKGKKFLCFYFPFSSYILAIKNAHSLLCGQAGTSLNKPKKHTSIYNIFQLVFTQVYQISVF